MTQKPVLRRGAGGAIRQRKPGVEDELFCSRAAGQLAQLYDAFELTAAMGRVLGSLVERELLVTR
jgi:hypothetical protein